MVGHSQERASLSSATLIASHSCLEIYQRVWTILTYELPLDVSIDRKQFPGKAPTWEVSRQSPRAAGVHGSERGDEAEHPLQEEGRTIHGEPEFQGHFHGGHVHIDVTSFIDQGMGPKVT